MKRRTMVAIVAGASIPGCLDLQETQGETSDDDTSESADDVDAGDNDLGGSEENDTGSEQQQVTDIELIELRDFGGPADEPNPMFRFDDYFGGTADLGDRMVLMDVDGDVVWESETINSEFSITRNFIGTPGQYYVWFVRDERTYVSAFDPDTGTERWMQEIVGRDTRELKEITATEIGVFQLTTAAHSDQYDQNPTVTHVDNDGTERWSETLQEEGYGRALLAYEGDLYVGITGTMFRLDAQSGDVTETYDIRTSHNGFTRRSNEMYVDTVQGLLRFDLASDEIVWNNEDARSLRGQPVIADDFVVVPSEAGWIDAYSAADGSEQWETRLDHEVRSFTRTGNVIWTTSDGVLYGFDRGSGDRVYERDDGQYRRVVSLNDRISITDYDEATLYRVEAIEGD